MLNPPNKKEILRDLNSIREHFSNAHKGQIVSHSYSCPFQGLFTFPSWKQLQSILWRQRPKAVDLLNNQANHAGGCDFQAQAVAASFYAAGVQDILELIFEDIPFFLKENTKQSIHSKEEVRARASEDFNADMEQVEQIYQHRVNDFLGHRDIENE